MVTLENEFLHLPCRQNGPWSIASQRPGQLMIEGRLGVSYRQENVQHRAWSSGTLQIVRPEEVTSMHGPLYQLT
jgi:hypothetical protein